jgi:hypothetical protein
MLCTHACLYVLPATQTPEDKELLKVVVLITPVCMYVPFSLIVPSAKIPSCSLHTSTQTPEDEELLSDATSLLAYHDPSTAPHGHLLGQVRGCGAVLQVALTRHGWVSYAAMA